MKRLAFAVPGDLNAPTGGYAYDRRVMAGLIALGSPVDVVALGDGFPDPDERTRQEALQMLRAMPPILPVVVDGLALGVLPELAALRDSHRLIALVHHPLALESGLTPEKADALRASEREALRGARHVVVTSDSTAKIVAANFGVPAAEITVIRPGTDRVSTPRRTAPNDVVSLLAVGSLVPRKGYDVLLAALAQLKSLQWRLVIVGASRDAETAARIVRDIETFGLTDRVTLAGALSEAELARRYRAADIFVLASRFEGYGMAYAEAIAHGLPVIGTTGGAVAQTVPEGAGILIPPDDVAALTEALLTLIIDPALREAHATAARKAAAALPTWDDAARRFAAVIEAVA